MSVLKGPNQHSLSKGLNNCKNGEGMCVGFVEGYWEMVVLLCSGVEVFDTFLNPFLSTHLTYSNVTNALRALCGRCDQCDV